MALKKIVLQSRKRKLCNTIIVLLIAFNGYSQGIVELDSVNRYRLTKAGAVYFAKLSLSCVSNTKEHYLSEYSANKRIVSSDVWPSFYGCFDWHSSVHNHWALVKLIKSYPGLPEENAIRLRLNESFTKENINKELEYLKNHEMGLFEFPYGQSWELKLVEELIKWNDPQGNNWIKNLSPLTEYIIYNHKRFWPMLSSVEPSGSHDSPAMGLSFALDYAITTNNKELENLISKTAIGYYGNMTNANLKKEPYGFDFMSANLLIADLMRKVYSKEEFTIWMKKFSPGLFKTKEIDVTLAINKEVDHFGMYSHWDGFHLNRIWCLNGIMKSISENTLRPEIKRAWIAKMNEMWDYSQKNIGIGNYANDHWLSSFSVFAMIGYD